MKLFAILFYTIFKHFFNILPTEIKKLNQNLPCLTKDKNCFKFSFFGPFRLKYWQGGKLFIFCLYLFTETLPFLGKFGASGAFSIVYLYTAEIFPTAIRGTATGLCSMMARIGGIAAPQVHYDIILINYQ